MRKSIVIAVMIWGILGWGFSGAFAASSPKIAVIDLQRCLNDSLEGKRAKRVLEAKNAKMKVQVEAAQKELAKLKAEVEKQGMMLSPSVLKEKERQYRKKQRELKEMVRDFNEELKQEEEDLKLRIFKDLDHILQKMAREKGFDLIFERKSLLYSAPRVDITKQVIRRYDALKRAGK